MDWYYAHGGDRRGPVGDDELNRLVQQGIVTSQTLIWREGLTDWQPYGAGAGAVAASPPLLASAPAAMVTCAGCGRGFSGSEVISLDGNLYCATCKPLVVQRLREGETANSAAEAIRLEHLKHEASVKSIGLLYYLGGAALIVFFIIAANFSTVPTSRLGGPLASFLAFILILVGVGQIVVGTGLRRLRSWARIPTGILSGLGLLSFPIGTLINAYILYLVFSRKGKMVFSEEYRAVMEQTPHIKYRTSILVWILIGLVVLVIGFALVAMFVGRSR